MRIRSLGSRSQTLHILVAASCAAFGTPSSVYTQAPATLTITSRPSGDYRGSTSTIRVAGGIVMVEDTSRSSDGTHVWRNVWVQQIRLADLQLSKEPLINTQPNRKGTIFVYGQPDSSTLTLTDTSETTGDVERYSPRKGDGLSISTGTDSEAVASARQIMAFLRDHAFGTTPAPERPDLVDSVEASGIGKGQHVMVENRSRFPVRIKSINIYDCVNAMAGACGVSYPGPTIQPGHKVSIRTILPSDDKKPFSFKYSYEIQP